MTSTITHMAAREQAADLIRQAEAHRLVATPSRRERRFSLPHLAVRRVARAAA